MFFYLKLRVYLIEVSWFFERRNVILGGIIFYFFYFKAGLSLLVFDVGGEKRVFFK